MEDIYIPSNKAGTIKITSREMCAIKIYDTFLLLAHL
jgi:hypothetical protein